MEHKLKSILEILEEEKKAKQKMERLLEKSKKKTNSDVLPDKNSFNFNKDTANYIQKINERLENAKHIPNTSKEKIIADEIFLTIIEKNYEITLKSNPKLIHDLVKECEANNKEKLYTEGDTLKFRLFYNYFVANNIYGGDQTIKLMGYLNAIHNNIIKTPDLQIVKDLVDNGADVNYYNPVNGTAPILFAARIKDPNYEILNYLLDMGANPNVEDKCGVTPLKNVCNAGLVFDKKSVRCKILDKMIEYGADVNYINRYGENPLRSPSTRISGAYEYLLTKGLTTSAKTLNREEKSSNLNATSQKVSSCATIRKKSKEEILLDQKFDEEFEIPENL